MKQVQFVFVATLVWALFSVPARADEPASNSTSKSKDFPRFRIGIEKKALYFVAAQKRNTRYDMTAESWVMGVSVMPSTFSIPTLVLGGRITERLEIGARINGQVHHSDNKETFDDAEELGLRDYTVKQTLGELSASPYVAWWFGKNAVRPFLSVEGTVGTTFGRTEFDYGEEYANMTRRKGIILGAGAGGGLHIFVGKHLSLDTSLVAGYRYSRSRNQYLPDSAIETSCIDSFELTGNLGISGWI